MRQVSPVFGIFAFAVSLVFRLDGFFFGLGGFGFRRNGCGFGFCFGRFLRGRFGFVACFCRFQFCRFRFCLGTGFCACGSFGSGFYRVFCRLLRLNRCGLGLGGFYLCCQFFGRRNVDSASAFACFDFYAVNGADFGFGAADADGAAVAAVFLVR
ncbi:Uncharacterised protein [Neisseria gonorrhoeae]|uniref:Uncharacterized protein n=1 Tax=Neisseria gonorrhoeae TaxID=485 RepID=A0A379B187_NEIGO|nr:Uncharacterised protein [Neisseria gonorrhoeae]